MKYAIVPEFRGDSAAECESFIKAIRTKAREEGKSRDSAWIAELAYPLFIGKALKWHARQPEDVQGNWRELEMAMIDHWMPDDHDVDK